MFCSEQYVPGLLRWKEVLSQRQVREIMDVIRDLYPNPRSQSVTTCSFGFSLFFGK